MKYHPDKNPEGRETFLAVQKAYECLQATMQGLQGPQTWRLLLLLKGQCILYRRYGTVLMPFKYAGYPMLLNAVTVDKDDNNFLSSDRAPLLIAASELVWLTCASSSLNGEELVRDGGIPLFATLLSRCMCVVQPMTPANEPSATIIANIMQTFSGFQANAVPYDYSYTVGCLLKPEAPQYNGGVAVNPEFNDGLKGWTAVGGAKMANAKSPDGNNYVVVSNRNAETDGVSQTFNMEKDKFYTVSAWVQVSRGKANVQARMQTTNGVNQTANWIKAQSGCWRMIKGGLTTNTTGPVDLHFETNVTGVDIWVDSVSVQPFTQEEWKSHQDDNREKARKTKVKFEAVDGKGQPIANATVSIRQREPNFPFGAAVNEFIIHNPIYQKWFLDRFKYTVFDNELKWAVTEEVPGVENYTLADKMLEFCKTNGISVRGHNILWDDSKFQMEWILKLSPEELQAAALKRVHSVVSRYKGQFIQWDVINENMHFNLFSKLQPQTYDASIFNLTHQIDPSPILFLNDYNVIEASSVYGKATPSNYLDKIDELRNAGYTGLLGIGLESHFDTVDPVLPYIRASLDMLATTGLPIWITEFDVRFAKIANPAETMELLMRELHSHAAVSGMIVWSAWAPTKGCWAMCTRTPDYKNNTLAGDLVDKFLYEFIKVADSNGTTDGCGAFEVSLYHGEYEVNVTLHNGIPSTVSQTFSLVPNGNVTTVKLKSNS